MLGSLHFVHYGRLELGAKSVSYFTIGVVAEIDLGTGEGHIKSLRSTRCTAD
jgi:hypothetical protein